MTGFLDWAGRVVMLVLAGMITLSIIGAIAAIPSGTVQTRMGMEPRSWPGPQPEAEPQPVPAEAPVEPSRGATAPAPQPGTVLAPAPKEPVDPARWLEAITYALLALVGAFVFAIVLLWRALGHWRRSADALEAIAARRGSSI